MSARGDDQIFEGTPAEAQQIYKEMSGQGLAEKEDYILRRYLYMHIPPNLEKYVLMTDQEYRGRLSSVLKKIPKKPAIVPAVKAAPVFTRQEKPAPKAADASASAQGETLTVNTFLIALRQEQGWSQRELAEKMGVARTYVSKVENQRIFPKIASLERFARAFEMSPSEFFGQLKAPKRDGAPDNFIGEILPFILILTRKQRRELASILRTKSFRPATQ